jgi:hypothetical protein
MKKFLLLITLGFMMPTCSIARNIDCLIEQWLFSLMIRKFFSQKYQEKTVCIPMKQQFKGNELPLIHCPGCSIGEVAIDQIITALNNEIKEQWSSLDIDLKKEIVLNAWEYNDVDFMRYAQENGENSVQLFVDDVEFTDKTQRFLKVMEKNKNIKWSYNWQFSGYNIQRNGRGYVQLKSLYEEFIAQNQAENDNKHKQENIS